MASRKSIPNWITYMLAGIAVATFIHSQIESFSLKRKPIKAVSYISDYYIPTTKEIPTLYLNDSIFLWSVHNNLMKLASYGNIHQIIINITCTGKTKIDNLRLHAEGSGIYETIYNNQPEKIDVINSESSIGSILPGEELSIILWVYQENPKIKIFYDEGYIIPKRTTYTKGFLRWMTVNWNTVKLLFMVIVFGVLAIYGINKIPVTDK